MEVERGRNVREEVNFPRAAQSLEGKGKARKHRRISIGKRCLIFHWEWSTDTTGVQRGDALSALCHQEDVNRGWWGAKQHNLVSYLRWAIHSKGTGPLCNFVGKVLHDQTSNLQASLSQMSTVPGTKSLSTSKILTFLWQSYFFLLPHIGVLFKVV